jgi:hypothetical protein
MNDDGKGKSPFQHPVHPYPTKLSLTFIITLPFLSRSNEMATDIGSLAPGMDGHAVRLGITKNLEKSSQFFFRWTHFNNVDSFDIVLLNITTACLPTFAYHF